MNGARLAWGGGTVVVAVVVAAILAAGGGTPTETANLFVRPTSCDATPARQASPTSLDAADPSAIACTIDEANDVCDGGDTVAIVTDTVIPETVTDLGSVITGSNGRSSMCTIAPLTSGYITVRNGLQLGASLEAENGPQWLDFSRVRAMLTDGRQGGIAAWPGTEHIVMRDFDMASFYLNGVKHVQVLGGDWGPCTSTNRQSDFCSNNKIDGNTAPFADEDITVDGAVFHDYRTNSTLCRPVGSLDCHFEAMFIQSGSSLTIRNSRFYGCAFYCIFVAKRAGDPIDGLTIENNWFDTPYSENWPNPSQNRGGSVAFSNGGTTTNPWKNVTVRFNTFALGTGISWNEDGVAYTTSGNVAYGNILTNTSCDTSRWTYSYNVMSSMTCGGTDLLSSSWGLVDGSHLPGGDWRLTSSSPARGLVPSGVTGGFPADDLFGVDRPGGSATDAGAAVYVP